MRNHHRVVLTGEHVSEREGFPFPPQFKHFLHVVVYGTLQERGMDLLTLFEGDESIAKELRKKIRIRKKEYIPHPNRAAFEVLQAAMKVNWDWKIQYVRFIAHASCGGGFTDFIKASEVKLDDFPEKGRMIILACEPGDAEKAMYLMVEAYKTRLRK